MPARPDRPRWPSIVLALAGAFSSTPAAPAAPPPTSTTLEKAADWPQFRGPGGLGISAAKGLPVTWSSESGLCWKTALPGPGASSPTTLGDRIFLTFYTGCEAASKEGRDLKGLVRHLLCLNQADGKPIWDKAIAAELPEQERIRENHGYASSTPAADAQRVYVFFGKSGVGAFDHGGRQLWRAEVGAQTSGWGSAASPVLHGDLVIVNASVESESLVALNRQTGKEVWRAGGIKEAWNTPLLVGVEGGKTELAVAIFGKVLGFDPATGDKQWTCDAIGCYIAPSMVESDGVVYCIGGRGSASVAVRAGGRGDVTGSHLLWKGSKGSNVSSPVYHDGHLYFVHDNLGIAYCLNARTGEVAYEERLQPSPGMIYASPVLADGKLYYVSRGGVTVVLAAKPKLERLAQNDLKDGSTFNASPAIAGSRLLLRSDRFLYCIGEK